MSLSAFLQQVILEGAFEGVGTYLAYFAKLVPLRLKLSESAS